MFQCFTGSGECRFGDPGNKGKLIYVHTFTNITNCILSFHFFIISLIMVTLMAYLCRIRWKNKNLAFRYQKLYMGVVLITNWTLPPSPVDAHYSKTDPDKKQTKKDLKKSVKTCNNCMICRGQLLLLSILLFVGLLVYCSIIYSSIGPVVLLLLLLLLPKWIRVAHSINTFKTMLCLCSC